MAIFPASLHCTVQRKSYFTFEKKTGWQAGEIVNKYAITKITFWLFGMFGVISMKTNVYVSGK